MLEMCASMAGRCWVCCVFVCCRACVAGKCLWPRFEVSCMRVGTSFEATLGRSYMCDPLHWRRKVVCMNRFEELQGSRGDRVLITVKWLPGQPKQLLLLESPEGLGRCAGRNSNLQGKGCALSLLELRLTVWCFHQCLALRLK